MLKKPLYFALMPCMAVTFVSEKALSSSGSESTTIDNEQTFFLEEITVTAQKRSASIQDIAASVSALDAETLERMRAQEMQDYTGFTPGVHLVDNGPSRTQVNMRGVSTGDLRYDRPEIGETVGMYLDESPISAQIVTPNLALLDIDRIEVLRGPQPTLYGAGSLSGTLRMISAKPNLGMFEGRMSAALSNTEEGGLNHRVDGVINVPLGNSERAALRTAAYYRTEDGFIDNIQLDQDNINSLDEYGIRTALRIDSEENWTLDLSYVYQNTENGGSFAYLKEMGELNRGGRADHQFSGGQSDYLEGDLSIASVTLEYDLPVGTLTSITSKFDKDTQFGGSADLALLFVGYPAEESVNTWFQQDELSQELRLVSNNDGAIEYILGAFYQRKYNSFGQESIAPGIDDFLGVPQGAFLTAKDQWFLSDVRQDSEQLAIYAEINVSLSARWNLSAGFRWFDVEQESEVFFGGMLSNPGIGTLHPKFDDEGINPKVALSYQATEDVLLYGQYSRGFRLGGTNQIVPNICDPNEYRLSGLPDTFESDTLDNYEVGIKSVWNNGKLRVNAAAYHIDWQNAPVNVDFSCAFSTVTNAGGFDVYGSEIDLQVAFSENLTGTFGFGYTNSELSEDLLPLGGKAGDPAPHTPEFTFSASLDHEFTLTDQWQGYLQASYRWIDSRSTSYPNNPQQSEVFKLDSYGITNLRLGLYDAVWQIEVFADNLLDSRAQLNMSTVSFQLPQGTSVTTNRPRTFGLSVTRNF